MSDKKAFDEWYNPRQRSPIYNPRVCWEIWQEIESYFLKKQIENKEIKAKG